ncbi:hypothetical protein LTR97_007285 [Elasticomyces elasticus]|uniref:Heterokaryon incompatibility domain-containing protein n=1 Tax=Elasticomyces elasticus TaxID=574655 RepID=A0AAN7W648_9PEZI|nr:hypothetical protein LTR97_007285 [Elasticomyces elasticus]
MSTAEYSDSDSASEADWSAASDASGMFETFVEPPQRYYHDYVNTGATLPLNAEISRPALTHPEYIRLIVVEPASKLNAPVYISFAVTTLAAPSAYLGFSYAWGPTYADGSHLTDTVYLNSLPLRVTAHLHTGLKNIRSYAQRVCSTDLLPLWIDTLCIDQQNVDERNNQVAMMGCIYARARAVLLWIGTPGACSRRSLKKAVLKGIKRNKTILKIAILLEGCDVDTAPCGTSIAHVKLPANVSRWILNQAYFSRRWVIQEILKQPNRFALIADQLINFEMLQMATLDDGKVVPPLCQLGSDPGGKSLLTNLIRYNTTECFDPRDRLFSLLAISDETHGITPAYSTSYADLYTRFAASCIRQDQLSTILACAAATRRYSGTNSLAMPSWVPDWRQSFPTADIIGLNVRTNDVCKPVVYNDQVRFDAQVYWVCQWRDRLASKPQHRKLIMRRMLAYLKELRTHQTTLQDYAEDAAANDDAYLETKDLVLCILPGTNYVLLLSSDESISRVPSEPQSFKLVDSFPLADAVPSRSEFRGFVLEALCREWEYGEPTISCASMTCVVPTETTSKQGPNLVLITSQHRMVLESECMRVALV